MGRLTSQIAHELNNPIYGIMNTLELLKTEIPPESKRSVTMGSDLIIEIFSTAVNEQD